MTAEEFVEALQTRGRCSFTTDELVEELDKSRTAVNAAIRRLREKRRVATPVRGFHVVVPPEYRRLECLPAQEFLPFLMDYLDRNYYVALLSAAFFHGAAHQQPQVFQVMVGKIRRDVECGRIHIEFHERKRISRIPTESVNTDYDQISLSTPEATAVDLVGFANQFGGMDRVATVLTELGEKIDGEELAELGPDIAPDAWLQRLGFILDAVGYESMTGPLADYISENVDEVTPLRPERRGRSGRPRDRKWRIAVNHDLEPDL